MVRAISSANASALAARTILPRDFLWLQVRDRSTNELVSDAYWSDVGTITAQIINPDSGIVQTRTWQGAGQLIQIDAIPAVMGIQSETVRVVLSQIDDRVADLIRGYEPKFGRAEIYRGLLNVDTRKMVAPAMPCFVGMIDEIVVETPEENGEGSVTLTLASHVGELMRTSTATRSHEDQMARHPGDAFFKDAAVVGTWQNFWGVKEKRG